MIHKTQKMFRRRVRSGTPGYAIGFHTELVLRETWWFLFLPLYSRDTIERTDI